MDDIIVNGSFIYCAANKHQLPKSKMCDVTHCKRKGIVLHKQKGHPAFTHAEEEVFVGTWERFSDHGLPLSRTRMKKAVSLFMSTMTKESREADLRSLMARQDGLFPCILCTA